jgi:hypothetical protein
MEQSNFVVRDVVVHIHSARDYYARHWWPRMLRRMSRNAWIYVMVVAISLGAGYLAMLLSDAMSYVEQRANQPVIRDVPSDLDKLTPEQKAKLSKLLQGMRR